MTALIEERKIVTDTWCMLDQDTPLPETQDIIVPFARWQEQRGILLAHPGKLGIIIGDEIGLEQICRDLRNFALIAIQFNVFRDGRGYTYARLLRERYYFTGAIRAIGDVKRDQLAYMERCGFSQFQMASTAEAENALAAFDEITVRYQNI